MLARSRDDGGSLYAADDRHLDFGGLIDLGLLYEAPQARTYWCGCGGGGTCEVTWAVHPKDGSKTPFIQCEYCGINRLDPKDLRVWTIQTRELLRMVGESMDFSSPFSEAIPGLVWLFGRKKRRDFYFVRRIFDDERQAIRSFFASHSTGVVIVPMKEDQVAFAKLDLNNPCFPLTKIAILDEQCRLVVDMTMVDDELTPVEKNDLKTNRKRGQRTAHIELLVKEMKVFYRESRDNFYDKGDILPKLTQKELGQRVGLRQDEVSRCLNDESAVTLQLLWQHAEDLYPFHG